MIDRNNRKTTYGYDSLNRRTGENWIGAGGVSVRSIDYTYDAVGNMITANDPDAKYTYSYDALNRLATLDNSGTNGVPAATFTYSYDEVGRLITVADKINGTNTSQTDYTYDLLDRAIRITQSGAGVWSKRVDMTYNQVNQMTGLSRFSDLGGQSLVAETSYTYDQNQRLIQLAHKKGASNLASYDYTFDAANKLTKIISSIDGTVDYAYDSTNQLTGADHSTQTDEAYQYDANGNRTNAGYQTGTNNQLQADGQFTYEYDGEGNRTKRTEVATGKITEYVWDYRNRLAGILFKNSSGVVEKSVEYVYDTNNLRIGKKIDGVVTERFAIDRNQISLVFDGSGVQKSRYLYGTRIDQVLAEESGAQVHWFLTDHQGTVKDVTDNAGTVIDHITYDSFGRIVGQTSPMDLRFAYTGREWDGETEQYYYRARYYDAAVGRFISEDPTKFGGGDINLYRYVGNSHINGIDPSGLESIMKKILKNVPLSVRQSFSSDNYWIWKPPLLKAFSGPYQHIEKFMDHYFNSNRFTFDLQQKGILESIKKISKLHNSIYNFDQLIDSKISEAVSKIRNTPCPDGKITILTLPINASAQLDITSENFSIGRTIFRVSALYNVYKEVNSSIKVIGKRKYSINDVFNDVADIESNINGNQELGGGTGYDIVGDWESKNNDSY